MSFTIYENEIILCSGSNLLACDLSSREISSFSVAKSARDENNQQLHNNIDIEAYHGITAVFSSEDGKFFGVCTNRKELCLYERGNLNLPVKNWSLVRAASRARFTPSNDIIVADKSGDAYLYSTQKLDAPPKLILGHLSMLLDILVTADEKHIISADRDEKIRISSFPNAYNIVSYCLGHQKFISAIVQSPFAKQDILISAGGDGCLKFWNYLEGKEIGSQDFAEKICSQELESLNESLKCFELAESVDTLPVKHLRIGKIDAEKATLALSFYGSKRILVYNLTADLQLQYLETIVVDEEPLEIILRGREMWILNDKGLKLLNLQEDKFEIATPNVVELNRQWAALRETANKQSLFPILYKRKFDNVQEYQDRKKSRLGN